MRLSCNFVNVYTIAAYRVQNTFVYTCTRAHPQRTSSWGKAREDPPVEVGEDVRVGVGVGPMEFKLYSLKLEMRGKA